MAVRILSIGKRILLKMFSYYRLVDEVVKTKHCSYLKISAQTGGEDGGKVLKAAALYSFPGREKNLAGMLGFRVACSVILCSSPVIFGWLPVGGKPEEMQISIHQERL
jgi:hypothetical protein